MLSKEKLQARLKEVEQAWVDAQAHSNKLMGARNEILLMLEGLNEVPSEDRREDPDNVVDGTIGTLETRSES